MSLYIDNNVVQADIDRRYELAGVDRHDRHFHDRHQGDLPTPRSGCTRWRPGWRASWAAPRPRHAPLAARRPTVAAGRPRHP